MPLVLRIDVDKPYGNHTTIRRIASKLFEETDFPCPPIGYLDHLVDLLNILSPFDVNAIFYFRICTLPTPKLIKELKNRGHIIGWHLENSKNFETFNEELKLFRKKTGLTPHSFTKHGSGKLKLGRHHYPKYEEEKYIEWAKLSGIPFYFGNSSISESQYNEANFYPNIFWLERNYRSEKFSTIEQAVQLAQTELVPVLTHPENVVREIICRNDLLYLIEKSKEANIQWRLL
jgi:hypothetical protein